VLKFTRAQLMAVAVVVLLGASALLCLSLKNRARNDITFSGPESAAKSPTDSTVDLPDADPSPSIRIHVAGRVRNPGVYTFKPGDRVEDAVRAAGGSLSDADVESINLAERLVDGEQVYIAVKGKMPPRTRSEVAGIKGSTSTREQAKPEHQGTERAAKLKSPTEGKVDINSATIEELQRIPGVGPSTAQRIIDYRSQTGKFKAVDELQEVKGIGPKKLEKLKPYVSL